MDKEHLIDKENSQEKRDRPVTADSVLGGIIDPFRTVISMPVADLDLPKLRRGVPPVKTTPKNPPKSSHRLGLIISAFIGVVVAFFLFPMIRYAERSTRSYVTDSWMTEINRRVDQYEQIYSSPGSAPRVEEVLPVNLALYSWQELHSDAHSKPALFVETSGEVQIVHPPSSQVHYSEPVEPKEDIFRQQPILLTGFDCWDEAASLDMGGVSNHMLLSFPGQVSSVRTALGQDILIRDGRVFFRTLPGTEPPNK